MAISSNFPSSRPSLLLDFANVGRLDPRVTFTRASSATYYDGVTTAKAEENLLLESQTMTTSPWTVVSASTTGSKTAPDGTSTAIEISATSANGRTQQLVTIVSGLTYTLSMFVRRVTGTGDVRLIIADSSGSSLFTTTMSLTANWQRFTVSGAPAVTSISCRMVVDTSGDAVEVWGAQLEQRSAVTAYTATTTQPITNYVPVLLTAQNNEARFDHTPTTGAALGLEIEEQRTNLQINSEDFTNADWGKGANTTIIGNSIIAPNGELTADTFGFTAITSGACQVQDNQSKAASSITYTGSIYVKASSGLFFHFFVDANGTANSGRVIVDTSTWSVFSVTNAGTFTNTSGTVTPVGNGWYRITCTTTSGTETNIRFNLYWSSLSNAITFTPAGTEQVYIWGAQLEAGAFATSYIPTTTTALTRSADAASMTGTNFSDWFSNMETTLYAEAQTFSNTGTPYLVSISTNTNTTRGIGVFVDSSGTRWSLRVRNLSVDSSVVAAYAGQAVNALNKAIIGYNQNSLSASVTLNAATPTTASRGPIVADQMTIGSNTLSGNNSWNGHIRKISYYPARLSDAQLQALTG